MPPSSTISSQGQITIPLEIRQRLGLKPGDHVEFIVDDDLTVIRPAQQASNPFEKFIGALPAFKSKAEINRWVRELREEGK
jgi:antitoxin PrlF